MSESAGKEVAGQDLANLKGQVVREILPAFHAAESPKISDEEVQCGVELLFELLAHRVGDAGLDAVGEEIVSGMRRWFNDFELVKLADRYEPFLKFVLRVIDPAKLEQLQKEEKNKLGAAKVLKAMLVDDKTFGVFKKCLWEEFPPKDVLGKPDFLEHVARIYVFRNVDDHQARELSQKEKADVAQSFCVFLVWCVIRFKVEIRLALTIARFTHHLKQVCRDFEEIRTLFVDLTTEERSSEEYRYTDPLATPSETSSPSEQTVASKLAEDNRVTIIEAEPGAGKTSTLKFLACQRATELLKANPRFHEIPVYVGLKLISHRKQTIEAAVEKELKPASGETRPIPWDSLLLLLDGVNEVATDLQTSFKAELQDLLRRHTKLRVVLAGRPNSFKGEFETRIVVLQRLNDKQLFTMFRRALGDDDKAEELLAAVLRSTFLASWSRTPLHAKMVACLAKERGIDALTDHSKTVRRFVRLFLDREVIQTPGQTQWRTKEQLLARFAFETKSSGDFTFSNVTALLTFAKARTQVAATSLDIPRFIQEILDNHLLQESDGEALEFAHELYHDYFAATQLEAQEQMDAGSGVKFALDHFSEVHWSECIRLFAGFSNSSRILIQRGAEKNPYLAWKLLRDASNETADLMERVSDEAYCFLSAVLKSEAQAMVAGRCIIVLADLGRSDLLEKAIADRRQIFELEELWEPTDEQGRASSERQKQAIVLLACGILPLIRLGMAEQNSKLDGPFSQASRSAIRGLERIKAARVLCTILSLWNGDTFNESSIIPGAVLDQGQFLVRCNELMA